MSKTLIRKAQRYLEKLCLEIPERYLGSEGNRSATDFFATVVSGFGFEIQSTRLDCLDWKPGRIKLLCKGTPFKANISPYSLSCSAKLPLTTVKDLPELEQADLKNKIVLLYGEIAKEQLMPKNFSFYNPEHHQKIIALLEQKKPMAIIAATGRNPESVGGLYPFPLIEDGDFDIPCLYITEEEGMRLLSCAGQEVSLEMESKRIPSTGFNISATKGNTHEQKIVFCAHIDSRKGSPGALDNAGGITVLLLLAELLSNYQDPLQLELAALNGHEYYSAPGAVSYLDENKHTLESIALAVNLDGIGYRNGQTTYSFYECPPTIREFAQKVFAGCEGMVKGEPWPQSDHMIFAMSGRPAVALTSDFFLTNKNDITHTEKDRPEIIDCNKLADVSRVLYTMIKEVGKSQV